MVDTYSIQINIDGQDNASPKLGRVNDELDDMRGRGNNASDSVNNLNGIITTAGLVTAAWQIADKVNELADLGREAQAANRVFTSLAGGTDAAAGALNQMQSATNGAVDNLTLMRGANQLLLTNLASSTDQAAELTQVAVQLGAAMGQDAAGAIDNFNSALLNNSFVRLDTLGISAQRVRERVEELKEAGMDMSEAFAQATLEEGRIAIERLGDAANVSESAFNRLSTQAQNFSQDLGSLLANATETAAQLAIIADIQLGGDGFGVVDTSVRNRADEIIGDGNNAVNFAGISTTQVNGFANSNPDLFNQISSGDFFSSFADGTAFTGAGAANFGFDQGSVNDIISQFGFDPSTLSADSLLEVSEGLDLAFSAIAQAQRELNPVIAETTDNINNQTSAIENNSGVVGKNAEAIEASAEAQAQALREATQFQEEFLFSLQADQLAFIDQLAGQGFTTLGDDIFFDPAQLGEVLIQADELQQRADEIAQLAEETDFEIITDDEVDAAQRMADEARDIADSAIEAADALERASLSDIFGQTDGGREAELYDAILGNIEDPEQRAQFEREFNLASGEETASSVAFDDEFSLTLTAIAEQFGADAAIAAAQRFDEAAVDGRAAGLGEEEFIASLRDAIGFTMTEGGDNGAGSTIVEAGEGRLAVAARLDIGMDELNDIIGENTVLQPGQEIVVPAGYELVPINDNGLGSDNFLIDPLEGVPLGGPSIPVGDEGDELSDRASTDGRFTEDDVTNAQGVEASMLNMETIDLSIAVDPLLEDLTESNIQTTTLEDSLNGISNASFSATVPLRMVLDDATGLNLAQSPGFQNAINFFFTSKGIDVNSLSE